MMPRSELMSDNSGNWIWSRFAKAAKPICGYLHLVAFPIRLLTKPNFDRRRGGTMTITIDENKLTIVDREFLYAWANNLNVSVEELLKRILLEAVKGGQLHRGHPR